MKWFFVLLVLAFYACSFDLSKTNYTATAPSLQYEQYLVAYDKALSLWPVPFQELIVKTQYGNAHVIASGPDIAPPIVLLHGMNASSTMWYPNIKELSHDYRVYAIDNLTEPGKSQMSQPVENIHDLISWYIEILDTLGIDRFALIGASKGGWIAVNIALHLSDRVQKLVLLSPLQTFGDIPPSTKMFSMISYALNPNRKHLRNVLKTMSTKVSLIDPLYVNQFLLGSRISDPSRLLKNFIPYRRKDLKKLKMPVLVLIGDKDIINKKSTIEKAKEAIAYSETQIIPDAGHFLSMDQTEITNTKILDFLKEGLTAFRKTR